MDRWTPMPFGKWKDTPIWGVPTSYLVWLCDENEDWDTRRMDDDLLDAIREEVIQRAKQKAACWGIPLAPPPAPPPPPVLRRNSPAPLEDCLELIAAGRKALAHKHHPDKGGTLDKMQQVNVAGDYLEHIARDRSPTRS